MLMYALSEIKNADDQQFMLNLYDQHKKIMFHTAKKYVSDIHIMEELVQDSLVKLIPKIPLLREMQHYNLNAYVVYTVRNTAINHLRHKSVENQYIIYDEPTDHDFPAQTSKRSVEDAVLSSERAKMLQQILQKLPEKEQTLLRGKYQFYQTDEELAEILNCKPGSVRMMLTRARRHALELLEKEGFSYDHS